MKQVTLQPGDYVATEGMTEEQYHAVARAFMNAGARSCEYPSKTARQSWPLFGWSAHPKIEGLFHGNGTSGAHLNGRQLTIDQVLNATNAGKETNMKNWKPEVGEAAKSLIGKCEVLAVDDKRGKSAVRWTDGNLGVVNTHILKPPMTEEDEAIEEMMRDAVECINAEHDFRALYRAGYRKQLPTEDMTDPANWRAGDWLECVVADRADLTAGSLYQVLRMDNHPVIDDDVDEGVVRPASYFRFHSRP